MDAELENPTSTAYCRLVMDSTCGNDCPASIGNGLSPYFPCGTNTTSFAIVSKVTALGRYEFYARNVLVGADAVTTSPSQVTTYLTNTKWPGKKIILGIMVTQQVRGFWGECTFLDYPSFLREAAAVIDHGGVLLSVMMGCCREVSSQWRWVSSTYVDSDMSRMNNGNVSMSSSRIIAG